VASCTISGATATSGKAGGARSTPTLTSRREGVYFLYRHGVRV
jgi:hypothetical protein